MKITRQYHELRKADAGTTGFFGRVRLPIHAGRRLLAAVLLFACGGAVQAALVEIPGTPDRGLAGDGRRPLSSWEGKARGTRVDIYGILPANAAGIVRRDYPAIGVTHPRDIKAHLLDAAGGSPKPESDLFAAIDAPYGGAIDATDSAAGDSDPELWTVLLVAAGLIGYQIRRKSRIGAIRVRPLQY